MLIRHIITQIDAGGIYVPAFQREYVWKREDVVGLVRSLLDENTIGTLLTWKTSSPPELKGGHKYSKEQGRIELLLDGQQRISTLYMLTKGQAPPYHTPEEIPTDMMGLHVNLMTLELQFYRDSTMADDPAWVDITTILNNTLSWREMSDNLEKKLDVGRLPKHVDNLLISNIERVRGILDLQFHKESIQPNSTVKEAIDIFHEVNLTGTALTESELALAQICGYWPEAKTMFKTKLKHLENKGWCLDLDFIARLLLAVLHQQGKDLAILHSDENEGEMQAAWDILSGRTLDRVLEFLRDRAYVNHTSELGSHMILIPLIYYFYKKRETTISKDDQRAIINWFYSSIMGKRYLLPNTGHLDQDLKIIQREKSPFVILLGMSGRESGDLIKPEAFMAYSRLSPILGIMHWCFKQREAVCLRTGRPLKRDMDKNTSNFQSSIFPHSLLSESGTLDLSNRTDYASSREFANQMFLATNEARSRSLLMPAAFLEHVEKKFPGALEAQCIPTDRELWELKNYKEFLSARRKLLASAVNDFLGKHYARAHPAVATVNYRELIDNGEDDTLEFRATLSFDPIQGKRSRSVEFEMLKCIVAFVNHRGGRLLLGVANDGTVLGLQDDLEALDLKNNDALGQHIKNIVKNELGSDFYSECMQNISFTEIDGKTICDIEVLSSDNPVFLGLEDGSDKVLRFYVRVGSRSQGIDAVEASVYVHERKNNTR